MPPRWGVHGVSAAARIWPKLSRAKRALAALRFAAPRSANLTGVIPRLLNAGPATAAKARQPAFTTRFHVRCGRVRPFDRLEGTMTLRTQPLSVHLPIGADCLYDHRETAAIGANNAFFTLHFEH